MLPPGECFHRSAPELGKKPAAGADGCDLWFSSSARLQVVARRRCPIPIAGETRATRWCVTAAKAKPQLGSGGPGAAWRRQQVGKRRLLAYTRAVEWAQALRGEWACL